MLSVWHVNDEENVTQAQLSAWMWHELGLNWFLMKQVLECINANLIGCRPMCNPNVRSFPRFLRMKDVLRKSRSSAAKSRHWICFPEVTIIAMMTAVVILKIMMNNNTTNNTINKNNNIENNKKSWQAVQGWFSWRTRPDIDCNVWTNSFGRTNTRLTCTSARCML